MTKLCTVCGDPQQHNNSRYCLECRAVVTDLLHYQLTVGQIVPFLQQRRHKQLGSWRTVTRQDIERAYGWR